MIFGFKNILLYTGMQGFEFQTKFLRTGEFNSGVQNPVLSAETSLSWALNMIFGFKNILLYTGMQDFGFQTKFLRTGELNSGVQNPVLEHRNLEVLSPKT